MIIRTLKDTLELVTLLIPFLFASIAWGANSVTYNPAPTTIDKQAAIDLANSVSSKVIQRYPKRAESELANKEFKSELNKYFQTELNRRKAQYEMSTVTVTTPTAGASIGTTLNFKEEQKTITLTVKPPILGFAIKDEPKWNVILDTGNKGRLRNKKYEKNKDGSVTFSFIIVEPDAVEKNVRVRYNAEVNYSIPSSVAQMLATTDLRELKSVIENQFSIFKINHSAHATRIEEQDIDAIKEAIKSLSDNIIEINRSVLNNNEKIQIANNKISSAITATQHENVENITTSDKFDYSDFIYLGLIPVLSVFLGSMVSPLFMEYRHNAKMRRESKKTPEIYVPD